MPPVIKKHPKWTLSAAIIALAALGGTIEQLEFLYQWIREHTAFGMIVLSVIVILTYSTSRNHDANDLAVQARLTELENDMSPIRRALHFLIETTGGEKGKAMADAILGKEDKE